MRIFLTGATPATIPAASLETSISKSAKVRSWHCLAATAGKTTTLRTMMGVLKPTRGTITFAGREITSLSLDRVNHSGIAIVPEGRRIFPNLTVV
jgi:ABC-type branched-subunit amino acid transport system ATPase component